MQRDFVLTPAVVPVHPWLPGCAPSWESPPQPPLSPGSHPGFPHLFYWSHSCTFRPDGILIATLTLHFSSNPYALSADKLILLEKSSSLSLSSALQKRVPHTFPNTVLLSPPRFTSEPLPGRTESRASILAQNSSLSAPQLFHPSWTLLLAQPESSPTPAAPAHSHPSPAATSFPPKGSLLFLSGRYIPGCSSEVCPEGELFCSGASVKQPACRSPMSFVQILSL